MSTINIQPGNQEMAQSNVADTDDRITPPTKTTSDTKIVHDQPVIGIVADGKSDNLAEIIIRAHTRGYDIFILTDHDECKAISLAQQFGVEVLTPDTSTTDGYIDYVRRTARENGYPGAIYHQDPAEQIDYEQSLAALHETGDCVVLAKVKSPGESSEVNLLIGIPAYNEEIAIGSVVATAQRYTDKILVIDDGSNDKTSRIARNTGAAVIEHDCNRGKGAAIKTLLSYAELAAPDSLVVLDGDGQHYAGDIPAVASPVLDEDADLVIGSRYLDDGNGKETPLYRRLGQKVLDFMTYITTGERVSDSQSGYRALSLTAIKTLDLNSNLFGVESGMIDQAAAADLTIKETRVNVRYEDVPNGQSQSPLRHGLSVLAFILQLIRDRHPILFFTIPGLLLMLTGGLYGMNAIVIYQSSGQFYAAKVLVSGFLTVFGMLGSFTGLILNRIGTTLERELDD